ncbi:MAG TPA: tetratricopeptide repeat protein [Micropepsaceae bacterium]|jgi:tetratricopeptide (TPR) repeat protein|nr:tetratricopeptide repeat protein [Micropepsaceae bacterium]
MRTVYACSALALLGLVATAGEANAVVLVLGGVAGSKCYATAEFGDPFQAFDICTKALSDMEMSVRDRAATYINRSVVRLRVHDWAGALGDTDLAISRVANMGEAYVNRGAALLNLNRPQDALTNLNKAVTIGLDKMHLAYYNRGLAKEKLNDPTGAYADYKKALELDPTFAMAADELKRFSTEGMPMMPMRS